MFLLTNRGTEDLVRACRAFKRQGRHAPIPLQWRPNARCPEIGLVRFAPFAALGDLSVHDHRGYGANAVLLCLVHASLVQVVDLHLAARARKFFDKAHGLVTDRAARCKDFYRSLP